MIPLNEALKKIKSSDISFFLYPKFISFTGIVNTFPFLSIACIDNKISLNSFPKQPAFILIPPPIVPGIQDKNSKPLKLFFIAKSDKVLSKTPLPAIIISSLNKEILLKSLLNLITIPSYKLSVIKVLDPAPKIKIFSLSATFFKKFINSFKLFAL